MTTTEKLLLTVPEAAERLALGQSKVYELLAAGEIASVKIGKSRRVPVAALQDFITSRLAEEATA